MKKTPALQGQVILQIRDTMHWRWRCRDRKSMKTCNQRTNGPVNAHLISWPSKAQNIQNLENIW